MLLLSATVRHWPAESTNFMFLKCCTPYVLPFESQSTTVINYTPTLRANFGLIPTVEVLYRQQDGSHIKAEVQITLNGIAADKIEIDHGGTATGYIKLSA